MLKTTSTGVLFRNKGITRWFCKLPKKPVSAGADAEKTKTPIPVVEPAPEVTTDIYKSKITQEIKQGLQNEEKPQDKTHTAEPISTPAEPVPEKDKVFIQKKITLWQKSLVILQHLKHSFIMVWKDTVHLANMIKRNGFNDENYSLLEMKLRRSITKDLIRFMPYSIMIILPGGELLLPPYFLLFPNSTPTQFMATSKLGERTHILSEKQEEGYNNLVKSLPKFSRLLDIDPIRLYEGLSNLQNSEGREKDRQFYNASDFEDKIAAFLSRRDKLSLIDEIGLNTMSSFELEQLNRLFYQLYVPGYIWVNLVYGAFFKVPLWSLKWVCKKLKFSNYKIFKNNPVYKFSFTLDYGPLSVLKKYLLLFQLRSHINHIRRQDRVLSRNIKELSQLSQIHLVEFAKQRGIRMEDKEEIVTFVEKYWLPLSLREDITNDMLVWITLLRYKYADILS